MKLLVAFLVCCVAAATATSGSSFEYGLADDVHEYLGQFVESIRQHFQKALDQLKEKIEKHRFIFELLKSQIGVIQDKILQLAKGKLLEKAGEIRDKILDLLKSYLEKLNQKEEKKIEDAFYDIEEGSFIDRLAARIKTSLDNFLATVMEKVEKYSDIANDIKDRIVAIKEKLQEIPKAGALKLLEIAAKVKEQLKSLLQEVIERISLKEEAAVYALYDANDEGFLNRLSVKIQEQLQRFLARIVELVEKYTDIASDISDRVVAIKEKLQEIPKAGFAKLLEIAGKVREQLKALLKETVDKIAKKHEEPAGYALFESEEGSFIDRLAARIKTSLDNFLATVMEKVEKYSDIANDIKDRIVAIKEKLQEIPKAGALKLLEIAAKVKDQLKSLLQEVIERISLKEEAAAYALYDANDKSFLSRLSVKIQEQLQKFLARIVELVEKYTDIASDISDRVIAIKEKLQEIPKAGFAKLLEIAGKVREQLKALLKETVDKIANKHEEPAGYALYESEEGSFIDRLAARIKTSLDNFLATVMEKVEKYSDIANDIKDRIVAIKEKLQEIPKAGALKLLEIAAKVKDQLKSLLQEVIERISLKEEAAAYALYDANDESFLSRLSVKIQEQLQKFLARIVELVEKYTDIASDISDRVMAIKEKLQEIPKAGFAKLLEIAGKVREQLKALLKETVDKIAKKHDEPAGYALYESEEGSFIDRLAARIKTSLDNFLATVMEKVEKYSDIANDIKDRIVAIKEKLQEIPKAGALKLLEIAAKVKEQLKSLLQEVIERISLKEEAAAYALYDANDEGFLNKLSVKIQEQLQRFLARIVELVEKYTDIASDISDRVMAIKEKLQEIPKAGFAKLLEIAGKVREQLKALLKETVDKIAKKHEEPAEYAMYDSEGGFFARIAERIRERLENALASIQARIEKYTEFALLFSEKIQAIKENLKELSSATPSRILEIAPKIRQQLKELLNDAWKKINEKQVAEYSLMSLGGETLVVSMARVVREKLQAVLDGIRDRLAQHKDLYEEAKAKIEDIQEHLNQLAKATLSRIVSTAQIIRNKLTELIKSLAGRITGITLGTPFADGARKPGESSRRRLQTHLDELKKRVAKYPEVQAQYQSRLDDLQQQVDAVADLSGFTLATTSSQVLKKIGALRAEILNIIGTKPVGSLFADEVRKPGDSSRRRLQTHLDELKKRVAKYPEVQTQYQDRLDDLQSQVDAVADLSGFNLATTSSQVLRKIGALRTEILNIIGNKRPGSF